MAKSYNERVGEGLNLLNKGLIQFVEREFRAEKGDDWKDFAKQGIRNDRDWKIENGKVQWDTHLLLSVMWNNWNLIFSKKLGRSERSIVSELQTVRNNWAHQNKFSSREAYRAIDSMNLLLLSINAVTEAREVEKILDEISRLRISEQSRYEQKKMLRTATEGELLEGIPAWRDVIMPHKDVAEGVYQKAEFAADLAQVYRGSGSHEYSDPEEFFRRTYLTDGLRHLLKGAIQRLSGKKGEPVIELQTNFGGGKTHSMLALFHLTSGLHPSKLLGVHDIFNELGYESLGPIRKAVLVGTDLNPASVDLKEEGVEVHTLWGELAYQLAGRKGYKIVEEADSSGVGPGADSLTKLFNLCGPCLVLIDEWVAFVRQLYNTRNELPAGDFEANLTFAQSLTEAVKRTQNTLLVASVPSSDIEVGGEAGKEALARLQNVFTRVQSPWKPATAEEGFEIVRRRLFQPVSDPQKLAKIDAVAKAFAKWYRANSHDFPSEVNEGSYERRMVNSYPIHPEVFERLYEDWGILERFQRTRGVLRLMASAIFDLWMRNDRSAMILPGMIPLDSEAVRDQLLYFLQPAWSPVVESNVDGTHSLPIELDKLNPNLAKYSASRRVSRTIFLGSAPTVGTSKPGLDERNIKLGCVQPGENAAIFSDALRKIAEKSTHLYIDGKRYWYDTKPTVTREAKDRASHIEEYQIEEEVEKRLRAQKGKGSFSGVHIFPEKTAEVPDEIETRLIILGLEHVFDRKNADSGVIKKAKKFLDTRGHSPRIYKNSLVFLAPDKSNASMLMSIVKEYLGWSSVNQDKAMIDSLTGHDKKTIDSRLKQLDELISNKIKDTFIWALVPTQPEVGTSEIIWEKIKIQGESSVADAASKKLISCELLITKFSPTRLRMLLDKYLWNDEVIGHFGIKKLCEVFGTYLYFDRLSSRQVLARSIEEGVSSLSWEECFAFAEMFDSDEDRFKGLKISSHIEVNVNDSYAVLVKPSFAEPYLEDKTRVEIENAKSADPDFKPTIETDAIKKALLGDRPVTQYFGIARVSGNRIQRDIDKVFEEVISHLVSEVDSQVEITLEINGRSKKGYSENIQNVITENSRTLKFSQSSFEGD